MVLSSTLDSLSRLVLTYQAKTSRLLLGGQPRELHSAINTTGTSFDAARPVYNRLTEFKRGTTEVVPGLPKAGT